MAMQLQREVQEDKDALERDQEKTCARLREAQVIMRLAPHLAFDTEEGEVPSSLFYQRTVGVQPRGERQAPFVTCPVGRTPSRRSTRITNVPTSGPSRRPPAPPSTSTGQQQRRGRCYFCRSRSHRLLACPRPHRRCSSLRCHVQTDHPLFVTMRDTCPFWRTAGNEA